MYPPIGVPCDNSEVLEIISYTMPAKIEHGGCAYSGNLDNATPGIWAANIGLVGKGSKLVPAKFTLG
jgi:hypothetical protein